ncbi:MAG: EF2563 family selenium-dependent molybdenum hydroxylase system protein [Deltaproteobacteria bacterium]|nr:EF2563 family selenium-dependent molybdenum hydroxylase system protein [Deltaproteobacteria bacterium]
MRWPLSDLLAVVKGGGDLATGICHRLHRVGFQLVVTEIAQPTVIRRTVALASAVYAGHAEVEGMRAQLARSSEEAESLAGQGVIAVLVDPVAEVVKDLRPTVVVDAILAKQNLGTKLNDAPAVIGVGPGFTAGVDVHAVVETNRGHNLGRVILEGSAEPDTGVPGQIGGYGAERVLRAPCKGTFRGVRQIGDVVQKSEVVAEVDSHPVRATIPGVLRGLLYDGLPVVRGMKVGDIDPRAKPEHCFTISDKARAVGGGVLEAALYLLRQR